jgi:hypothetical protein
VAAGDYPRARPLRSRRMCSRPSRCPRTPKRRSGDYGKLTAKRLATDAERVRPSHVATPSQDCGVLRGSARTQELLLGDAKLSKILQKEPAPDLGVAVYRDRRRSPVRMAPASVATLLASSVEAELPRHPLQLAGSSWHG